MEIFNIIVLVLSGFLLTMVGTSRLFNTIRTYAKNSGIDLPKEKDILNETRA